MNFPRVVSPAAAICQRTLSAPNHPTHTTVQSDVARFVNPGNAVAEEVADRFPLCPGQVGPSLIILSARLPW